MNPALASDAPLLLTEIDPAGYALLTLNRPQAMNALSRGLMAALAAQIDTLAANPAVRVLILTGAGRAFSAGLDLKEIGAGLGPGQPGAGTGRFAARRPCARAGHAGHPARDAAALQGRDQ